MSITHTLTDLIIAISALSSLGIIISSIASQFFSGKTYGSTIFASILAIIYLGALAYWLFRAPSEVKIVPVTIDIPSYTGKPFTIALISDPHVGVLNNNISFRKTLEILTERKNDYTALFIAGDITHESVKDFSILTEFKNISSVKPVYAVLGNHDYMPKFRRPFESKELDGISEAITNQSITLLKDECISLPHTIASSVSVVGTKDIYFRVPELSCMESISNSDTIIMLSHNPDIAARFGEGSEERKPDLILSGHTHGGELRLPFGIPVFPLPVHKIPKNFDKGLFEYNDIPLYITSGTGSVVSRLKTWNNPEIVFITIR